MNTQTQRGPPAPNEGKHVAGDTKNKRWNLLEREVTHSIEEMTKLQRHRRAGTMTQAYWDSVQDKQNLNTYSILQRIIQGAANDRVLELQEDRNLSTRLSTVITLIEERLNPIWSQLDDISRKLEEKTETSSANEDCRSWVNMEGVDEESSSVPPSTSSSKSPYSLRYDVNEIGDLDIDFKTLTRSELQERCEKLQEHLNKIRKGF